MENNPRRVLWLLAVVMSFPLQRACAQETVPGDTLFVAQATQAAVDRYRHALWGEAILYNGREYTPNDAPAHGHPYFQDDYFDEGTVTYDGLTYEGIPMLYDLLNDKLVIEHFDEGGRAVELELDSRNVSRFTLFGHTFLRLPAGRFKDPSIRSGFYDLLCDGDATALVRRRKSIRENIEPTGVETFYDAHNDYYIFYQGILHRVKSRSSVLRLFRGNHELLHFVRGAHLNFHRQREQAIVKVVRHLDETPGAKD